MSIGLRLGRSVRRHRRAQIAETGHRDHANTLLREAAGESHALIVAAAAAVDDQQGRACACLLILDRSARSVEEQALLCNPIAGRFDIGVKPPPNQK